MNRFLPGSLAPAAGLNPRGGAEFDNRLRKAYNMETVLVFEAERRSTAVRGSYDTRQKKEIAAYFRAHPGECVTVEQVYAALEAKVGMTTVYRAVSRLCGEGRLRRYAPPAAGEAALYQWNPCAQSHLHIRCVDCGSLEHLCCDVAQDFTTHLRGRHGFVLDEGQTVLYGRCARCEAKRLKKKQA